MSIKMTKKHGKNIVLMLFWHLKFVKRIDLYFKLHGLYNIHKLEVKKELLVAGVVFQGGNTLKIVKKMCKIPIFRVSLPVANNQTFILQISRELKPWKLNKNCLLQLSREPYPWVWVRGIIGCKQTNIYTANFQGVETLKIK